MPDTPLEIPVGFARCMSEVYGDAGTAWIERLPGIIDECARRWSLTVAPPYAPLSYNYVAPAAGADGTPLVLKIGFPCPEQTYENEALQLFDGKGICRLLAADSDAGARLLEQVQPGTPIDALKEETAVAAAADVMQRLWRPAPAGHPFPTIADWGKGFLRTRERFGGSSGPLPLAMFERGEALFAELLASSTEPVLLHGDLHHFNILAAGPGRWLAIDPKGVVGEPAYEVGALLRNPRPSLLDQTHPAHLLAQRIDLFAGALGFDRQRVRDWGIAQAVLSACWSVEDHAHGWEYAITCAELLSTVPA